METLHPQWSGYGMTWRRDLNAIAPEQYAHGSMAGSDWLASPFKHLIDRALAGEESPSMRRRLSAGPDQRDFPVLMEFYGEGATDYIAYLFAFGDEGDRSQGTGVVYSFATDRRDGFSDDDTTLVQATLPALSLAMKAHAGYVIASGLLGTYLGEDAGRRVHAGSIMRGSVDKLRAVLWYADIRGFTAISDRAAGPVVVELLNEVFEILTASLRERGGQVLKFIGDGMLATFAFEEPDRAQTCAHALDAATEAMRNLDALNAGRAARRSPPSISLSISARCCTATSAQRTGSISPSSARRSTRSRASRLCASRSGAPSWRRRSSSQPRASVRGASSRSVGSPFAASGRRRRFLLWIWAVHESDTFMVEKILRLSSQMQTVLQRLRVSY
jgi:GGDEF domain-containing protein